MTYVQADLKLLDTPMTVMKVLQDFLLHEGTANHILRQYFLHLAKRTLCNCVTTDNYP